MDVFQLILEAFEPVAGRHILDIGCGAGALAKRLASRGAVVTGVDVNACAVTVARRDVPSAAFLEASAAALPLPAATFDGGVFLNSLHHMDDPRIALRESKRVLRSGSHLVVVEPLARGSFFDVLRSIDDETVVRAMAQDAIVASVRACEFHCDREMIFERVEAFGSVELFLAKVAAADPQRSVAIEANRPAILNIFHRVSERDGVGRHLLRQPLQVHVLSPG